MAEPILLIKEPESAASEKPDLMRRLKSRFPARQEWFAVFCVFIFASFSWSFYRMFWYVPSWLEYLNVWRVLTIAAYVAAFALLESLVMTGLLVLLALFFPLRFFVDRFALIGSSLAGLLSLAAFLLQRKINLVYRLELWQLVLYPILLLACLALVVFLLNLIYDRIPVLARFVKDLAERLTIFAYFYIPIGLVGMLLVLVRNLFGMP